MISVASHEPQSPTSVVSPPPAAATFVPSPAENKAAPSETTAMHIFRSKLPDIPISNHLPLHTYCFENVADFPDKTCLIVGSSGKTFTYAETHLICKKTAVGLTNLGIKRGDVIMVLLQNCAEFVFSFMGASMVGAITTTANPFYTPAEIEKQFRASNSKLIITQSLYVEKLKELRNVDDVKVVTIDNPPENCMHFSVLSEADDADFVPVPIQPDDAVALPYSSGTTGLPKGVVLTHKSLVTSVAQQVDGENPNLYLSQNDVFLCVLPLFHIFSLNSVLLTSLRVGAGILLMHKFEIGAFLSLIEKHKVTAAAVVPPLVIALAKNPMVADFDLSSIRIVLSGGAPLGKELEESLKSRVPQAIFGHTNP